MENNSNEEGLFLRSFIFQPHGSAALTAFTDYTPIKLINRLFLTPCKNHNEIEMGI